MVDEDRELFYAVLERMMEERDSVSILDVFMIKEAIASTRMEQE